MTQDAMLDAKVAAFFEWLKSFESSVQRIGGGARRYAGDAIGATVRYSWFKPSAAGLPSICLADFELTRPLLGIRFLERLAMRFAGTQHELQAQVLYVEQPQDRGLCDWLADHGFSLCAASGPDVQSWHLHRTGCRTSTATQPAPAAAARLLELKFPEGDAARRPGKALGVRSACKAPVPLESRRHLRLAVPQLSLPRWPLADAPRVRKVAG